MLSVNSSNMHVQMYYICLQGKVEYVEDINNIHPFSCDNLNKVMRMFQSKADGIILLYLYILSLVLSVYIHVSLILSVCIHVWAVIIIPPNKAK